MNNYHFNNCKHHRLWRSMLFVPANQDKYVNKAHTRHADAIILDLEDSIPLSEKNRARLKVASAATSVSQNGADVLVRINANWRIAVKDLETVISKSIIAIMVPKVRCAEHLQFVSDIIDELEIEQGIKCGHTKLVALIESPEALPKLESIANATPRLLAMTLGTEDFSMASGMHPTPDSLLFPSQQILFAARVADLMPLGFIASITEYSDKQSFKHVIERSRKLGFVGGLCIHPTQVLAMNEGFSPSEDELKIAHELVNAYQDVLSKGLGAFEFKGKMVDLPVITAAEKLIQIAEIIVKKNFY